MVTTTRLDQTIIDHQTGTIGVRFRKLVLDDDGTPIGEPSYHRVTLPPGTDIDATLDNVAKHVTGPEIKAGPIPQGDLDEIRSEANRRHTPEVIRAHVERQLADFERRSGQFPMDARLAQHVSALRTRYNEITLAIDAGDAMVEGGQVVRRQRRGVRP